MKERLYLTDLVEVKPSEEAKEKLWHVSYACKDIWNILNEEKRERKVGYYALKRKLPELKDGCERLRKPCSQTLQEVVKSLCGAWGMYFTKKGEGDREVKPPHFKSFNHCYAQKYPQQGVSFEIHG
jgi:hypothetical protein